MSTRLEVQFANFSTHPDYGTAQEGVQLIDMDTRRSISPEDIGMSASLDSINEFMESRGANPEHLKYTTIGLFGPDSSYSISPGTTTKRVGFVGRHYIYGNIGLRFPLIALQHDNNNPSVDHLNFNLRHEISHLLETDSIQPYNNERLIARIKAISATIGAFATPPAIDMWTPTTLFNAAYEGIGPAEYMSALLSCSGVALAAIALTYGLAHKPRRVMNALSIIEYRADHFARRNRHFQPFSQST